MATVTKIPGMSGENGHIIITTPKRIIEIDLPSQPVITQEGKVVRIELPKAAISEPVPAKLPVEVKEIPTVTDSALKAYFIGGLGVGLFIAGCIGFFQSRSTAVPPQGAPQPRNYSRLLSVGSIAVGLALMTFAKYRI